MSIHGNSYGDKILNALDRLAIQTNKITLYSAGLPDYPSNFTRDSILAAILMEDKLMLRNQLIFCSLLQGSEKNPSTGEEPGKIFHQIPPTYINGLSSEYDACDTTALFLIGHEKYWQLTHDEVFLANQKKYLEKAVEYILSHLINNMFAEDPKYSGSNSLALRVTYWKDSQVTNREGGIPAYPAVFTLAHIQNMKALRCAAMLLKSAELHKVAFEMKRHMTILFDDNRGIFYSGVDKLGFFPGTSSDNLHLLYYLEPGDLPDTKIEKIIYNTRILESELGFMTLNRHEEWLNTDITNHTGYHSNTVWPFEQAFIHKAARDFDLNGVADIAARIYKYLDSFPELFIIGNNGFVKGGSEIQLWTIAAAKYFYDYYEKILPSGKAYKTIVNYK